MSVVIGSGSTSPRQARWLILAMLVIALAANGAFNFVRMWLR
jgi:hypothetical protein